MVGSTYTANKWSEVQAVAVQTAAKGTNQSCTAGTTTNIDLTLTDDSFIRGIEFMAQGQSAGDTITIEVLDSNNNILGTPVSNWNVPNSSMGIMLSYEAVVPMKVPGTYTLRTIYNSTGILTPVTVYINYLLLKVLF